MTLGVGSSQLYVVRAATEAIGLTAVVENVEAFVQTTNAFPVSDPVSGIRVDLISSRRPVGIVFNGVTVRCAAAADLIIHKLDAGRARYIEDVARVLSRTPSLDREYLPR